jgi:hypothetical protein
MENNVPVDVIYPDISKTFDKVRLMLKKLAKLGLGGSKCAG